MIYESWLASLTPLFNDPHADAKGEKLGIDLDTFPEEAWLGSVSPSEMGAHAGVSKCCLKL